MCSKKKIFSEDECGLEFTLKEAAKDLLRTEIDMTVRSGSIDREVMRMRFPGLTDDRCRQLDTEIDFQVRRVQEFLDR